MNILHIISGDLWGGAESVTLALLNELKKSKEINLSIILFNDGILAKKLKDDNFNIFIIDENTHNFFELLKLSRNHIQKFQANIIHSHGYKENLVSFFIAPIRRNIRRLTTIHGLPEIFSNHASGSYIKIQKLNLKITKYCFNKNIAVSKDISDKLLHDYAFRKKRVAVVLNGLSLIMGNQKSDHKSGTLIVGTAARLVPVKNIKLLIDIAKDLSALKSNIKFLIAGDGPQKSELENYCKNKQIKNVEFIGEIQPIQEFYDKIDVYMNTSLHEGIPMTLLEAMSYGIPVIAPRVGGIPEIIDQTCGILIDNHEIPDYVDALVKIQENETFYKLLSENSIEKIKLRFSSTKMAENYFQIYKSLVK